MASLMFGLATVLQRPWRKERGGEGGVFPCCENALATGKGGVAALFALHPLPRRILAWVAERRGGGGGRGNYARFAQKLLLKRGNGFGSGLFRRPAFFALQRGGGKKRKRKKEKKRTVNSDGIILEKGAVLILSVLSRSQPHRKKEGEKRVWSASKRLRAYARERGGVNVLAGRLVQSISPARSLRTGRGKRERGEGGARKCPVVVGWVWVCRHSFSPT